MYSTQLAVTNVTAVVGLGIPGTCIARLSIVLSALIHPRHQATQIIMSALWLYTYAGPVTIALFSDSLFKPLTY